MSQSQFDFDRGEQIHLVNRSPLPKRVETTHGAASGTAMRAVLVSIDDHGRGRSCWPSIETIAAHSGLSRSTVRRTLKALAQLDVLITEKKGRSNHYTIVWSSLASLDRAHQKRSRDPNRAHGEANRAHGETNRAHDKPLTVQETTKKRSPPPSDVESRQWQVVVSELNSLGMKAASAAVDTAKSRTMSLEHVNGLIAEWKSRSAANPAITVGWLYRWITGLSEPEATAAEVDRAAERATAIRRRTRQQIEANGRMTIEMLPRIVAERLRAAGLGDQITESERQVVSCR